MSNLLEKHKLATLLYLSSLPLNELQQKLKFLSSELLIDFSNEELKKAIDIVSKNYPITIKNPAGIKELMQYYKNVFPKDDEIKVAGFVWKTQAKTWGDVIFLYIKFIEGIMPASPTHLGELTLDVQSAGVQGLIAMNQLGFITIDSQPGICEEGTNPMTKQKYIEEQRQYILGYYTKNNVKSLFNILKKYGGDNLAVYVVDFRKGNNIYIHQPEWDLRYPDALLYKYDRNTREKIYQGTAKEAKDNTDFLYSLTYSKFKSEPVFTASTGYTAKRLKMPTALDMFESDNLALTKWLQDNTVRVWIIAKEFCKPNILDKIVIKSLIENTTPHAIGFIIPQK